MIGFPWEFDGDPDQAYKLWIVARNLPEAEMLLCFKPTSQTSRWDREPELLVGVIEYNPGDLEFFNRRTIIDPEPYKIAYSRLRSIYVSATVNSVGHMPADFSGRISRAIKDHPSWNNQKKKSELLRLGLVENI